MIITKRLAGKRIKIIKGDDYLNLTGVIEYCNTCCRCYQIQFDGIGNSEKYAKYKDKLVFIEIDL